MRRPSRSSAVIGTSLRSTAKSTTTSNCGRSLSAKAGPSTPIQTPKYSSTSLPPGALTVSAAWTGCLPARSMIAKLANTSCSATRSDKSRCTCTYMMAASYSDQSCARCCRCRNSAGSWIARRFGNSSRIPTTQGDLRRSPAWKNCFPAVSSGSGAKQRTTSGGGSRRPAPTRWTCPLPKHDPSLKNCLIGPAESRCGRMFRSACFSAAASTARSFSTPAMTPLRPCKRFPSRWPRPTTTKAPRPLSRPRRSVSRQDQSCSTKARCMQVSRS